ncbi:MAG: hypothetical protein WB495_14400, partial [Xanthobacteraceae bacterium]
GAVAKALTSCLPPIFDPRSDPQLSFPLDQLMSACGRTGNAVMHATYLSPANFFTVGAFFECRRAMGTDGIRRTGRRRESVSGRRALMTTVRPSESITQSTATGSCAPK